MANPIKTLWQLLRFKVPDEEPDPEVVERQERIQQLKAMREEQSMETGAAFDEVMAQLASGKAESNGG